MDENFEEIIKRKKEELNSKNSKTSSQKSREAKVDRETMVDRIYSHIIENAGIDPLYRQCSFRNYETDHLCEENCEVFKTVKDYADNILSSISKPRPKSMYLYSRHPGIGKTHLAVATLKRAAKKIAEREYEKKEVVQYGVFPYNSNWSPVYFINVSEGLMDIKNDIEENHRELEKSRYFQKAKTARLVVFDDIFNDARYSPFVLETLLYWVDYRLKNELATIFTSNHNFEKFLKEASSPVKEEDLQVIARNIASRVHKMVAGYKISLQSSPQTDYRKRGADNKHW